METIFLMCSKSSNLIIGLVMLASEMLNVSYNFFVLKSKQFILLEQICCYNFNFFIYKIIFQIELGLAFMVSQIKFNPIGIFHWSISLVGTIRTHTFWERKDLRHERNNRNNRNYKSKVQKYRLVELRPEFFLVMVGKYFFIFHY